MPNEPVTVVIPLHQINAQSEVCIKHTAKAMRENDVLLVVSDKFIDDRYLPVKARLLLTGAVRNTSPAEKRDFALGKTDTPFSVFIDDDAFPAQGWIERALDIFRQDPQIAAVGGPGITPEDSSWAQRCAGAFYESSLGSGSLRSRFVSIGTAENVDDWPAYNLIVKTAALREVGGWGTRLYGGEDTRLCEKIAGKGYRIVADPDVVVYHVRRPLIRPLARQLANVGRHRGWFVRVFPGTSRRIRYFAPSLALLVGALSILILALTAPSPALVIVLLLAFLWTAVTIIGLLQRIPLNVAVCLPVALAVGHLAYGIGFVKGLVFTREIDAM